MIRCRKSTDKGAGISGYFLSCWDDLAYQIVAYSIKNCCKLTKPFLVDKNNRRSQVL